MHLRRQKPTCGRLAETCGRKSSRSRLGGVAVTTARPSPTRPAGGRDARAAQAGSDNRPRPDAACLKSDLDRGTPAMSDAAPRPNVHPVDRLAVLKAEIARLKCEFDLVRA